MDKKLQLLGFSPIKNFKTNYGYFFLCKYKKNFVLISNNDKQSKVWDLLEAEEEHTIVDTYIIEQIKPPKFSEVGIITRYGMYIHGENYLFKNYEQDVDGEFEFCLITYEEKLPRYVADYKHPILTHFYRNGYYKYLEDQSENYDIFLPKSMDMSGFDVEFLYSHVKIRNEDETLTGSDISRVTVLDEISLKNIRLLIINEPIDLGDDEIEIVEENDEKEEKKILRLDSISASLKEANMIKQKYDNFRESYKEKHRDLTESLNY